MKLETDKHSWLCEPSITRIFDALPSGSTRFVGGCVRNAILGETIDDIDLATQIKPSDVVKMLAGAGIKTIPSGIDHGTVTAVNNGVAIEITSLRKDVQTDGRRAVVTFTQDWQEDAFRRDLTINALYADLDGQVYDPSGFGLDDIKSKKFRFVGDADARVREDYLRILRFFRFIAWYGKGSKIDAEALKACRENRAGMKKLSPERVWSEIKKLLLAPDPSRSVRIMLTNEILNLLLPEASNSEGLALLYDLEKRENLQADPMLRLMSMAARDEFALAGVAKRLKLSNSEKTRLLGWAGDRTVLTADLDERATKIAVYIAGAQTIYDRAVIRAAGAQDPLMSQRWMALARFSKDWVAPEFPLKGRDLADAGVPKGPQMGKILDALKALWVKSGFTATKERLLMALSLIQN